MKYTSTIAALASLAILAGCGDKKSSYQPVEPKPVPVAKVATGEEVSLLPLAVGNTWRYDVTMSQMTAGGLANQKAEFLLEVKTASQIEGGQRAQIDVSRGDVLQDKQVWRVDKTGIYQEEMGLEKRIKTDGQPAIVFPIEFDKPFDWSGTAPTPNGKTTDMKTTVVTKGVEEVDALIGTVSAYRVETTQRFKNDKGDDIVALSVVYWAPKIGLIRQKQEVKLGARVVQNQLMILKQYTIK